MFVYAAVKTHDTSDTRARYNHTVASQGFFSVENLHHLLDRKADLPVYAKDGSTGREMMLT